MSRGNHRKCIRLYIAYSICLMSFVFLWCLLLPAWCATGYVLVWSSKRHRDTAWAKRENGEGLKKVWISSALTWFPSSFLTFEQLSEWQGHNKCLIWLSLYPMIETYLIHWIDWVTYTLIILTQAGLGHPLHCSSWPICTTKNCSGGPH